jgi:tetratricopeptide (TPR) repeat protein
VRLYHAVDSYLVYLQHAFWPAQLAAYYPYTMEGAEFGRALLGTALLGTISVVVLLLSYVRPYAIMGWLWFVGTLVPVIGLMQVGDQAYADRYMYIPLIGITIIVAFAAQEIAERSRFKSKCLAVAALGIVIALSSVASVQVRSWKDSFSLFERALDVSPGAAFPHVRLGMINAMQGQFEKAQEHFDLAFERDATQAAVVVHQLESMAASFANGGRFLGAVRRMELAVLVAARNGEEARVEALGAQLSQYREAQRLVPNGSR